MALLQLPYGTGYIPLNIRDDGSTKVYLPNQPKLLEDPLAAAREALAHPVGTPPLGEMLKERKPRSLVVIVNDETRPTPYDVFFPPLLEAFAEAGIPDEHVTFVVATGLHKPQDRDLDEKTYG